MPVARRFATPAAAPTDGCRVGGGFARATLGLTASVLQRHPERIPGTPGCRAAARRIAALLAEQCDSAQEEPFTLHPGSLWNVGRIVSLAYVLAALCLVADGRLAVVSAAVSILALVYAVTHYVICRLWFDRAFSAAEDINVVGVIEPAGEVRRQVLVVGHHDSPYVLTFLAKAQRLARLRLTLAALSYLYLTVVSCAQTAALILGRAPAPLRGWWLVLALVGLCFAAPLCFLVGRKPSPGAGDNLVACAIAVNVAGLFAGRRNRAEPLCHTRLVLLSTDGEEAGQRGAIEYARQHRSDLPDVPTLVARARP